MRYVHEALVLWHRQWGFWPAFFYTYQGEPAVFAQEPVPGKVLDNLTHPSMFGICGPMLGDEWGNQKQISGQIKEYNTQVRYYARKELTASTNLDDMVDAMRIAHHKDPSQLNTQLALGLASFSVLASSVSDGSNADTETLFGRVANIDLVLQYD